MENGEYGFLLMYAVLIALSVFGLYVGAHARPID